MHNNNKKTAAEDQSSSWRQKSRLVQVRQQSKDFARNIRQKVGKEKQKQLDGINDRREKDLNDLKKQCLLETKNKYNSCVARVGQAHLDAAKDEDRHKRIIPTEDHNERQRIEINSIGRSPKIKHAARSVDDLISLAQNHNIQDQEIYNFYSDSSEEIETRHNKSYTEDPMDIRNTLPQPKLKYDPKCFKAYTSSMNNTNDSIQLCVPVQFTQVSDFLKSRSDNDEIKSNNTLPIKEKLDIANKLSHPRSYEEKVPDFDSRYNRDLPVSSKKTKPLVKAVTRTKSLKPKTKTDAIQMKPNEISKTSYVPLFIKTTSMIPQKLKTQSSAVGSLPSKLNNQPMKKTLSNNPNELNQNVKYYDHTNRFTKDYPQPPNLVEKWKVIPGEVNAMDRAKEEGKLDMLRFEQIKELKRKEEMRKNQTIERERIRKDYNLLNEKLDLLEEFKKTEHPIEMQEKMNDIGLDDRIRNIVLERQKQMNHNYEDILRNPILITCRKLNSRVVTDNSNKENINHLNVSRLSKEECNNQKTISYDSSESCTSILLGYVDDRFKELKMDIDEHDGFGEKEKVEKLLLLLEQINYIKTLLMKELSRSKMGINIKSMDVILETVREIEEKRESIVRKRKKANNEDITVNEKVEYEKGIIPDKDQYLDKKDLLTTKLDIRTESSKTGEKYGHNDKETENRGTISPNPQAVQAVISSISPLTIPLQLNIELIGNSHIKSNLLEGNHQPSEKLCRNTTERLNDILKSTKIHVKQSVATEDNSLSTSYRSLPDRVNTDLSNIKSLSNPTRYNNAKRSNSDKSRDPNLCLKHYIRRLLGMSRESVEQLYVSSSETFDTPGSSTINTSANITNSNSIPDFKNEFIKNKQFFYKDSLPTAGMGKVMENHLMNILKNRELERKCLVKENRDLHKLVNEKFKGNNNTKLIVKPILKKSNETDKDISSGNKFSPEVQNERRITPNQEVSVLNRIADLDEMISKVRGDKQKLLESTFSSIGSNRSKTPDAPNTMDYYKETINCKFVINDKDISTETSPCQTSDLRNTEYPRSEENNDKLGEKNELIRVSKDSGIYGSRPVTSEDVTTITPDVDLVILPELSANPIKKDETNYESRAQRFDLLFNDIPKYYNENKDTVAESDKNKYVDKSHMKPPTAISRYMNDVDKQQHELSTIMEVDTPAMSHINASNVDLELPVSRTLKHLEANLPDLIYQKFPEFKQYIQEHNLEWSSTIFNNSDSFTEDIQHFINLTNQMAESHSEKLENLTNYLEMRSLIANKDESNQRPNLSPILITNGMSDTLQIKKFPLHNEYANNNTTLLDTRSLDGIDNSLYNNHTNYIERYSGSDHSLPDMIVEMKRRNMHIPANFKNDVVDSTQVKLNPKDISGIELMSTTSSSSNDLQMALHSIPWAKSMIKKSKEVMNLVSSTSSSSNTTADVTSSKTLYNKELSAPKKVICPSTTNKDNNCNSTEDYSQTEGRPLNLKEFLARELLRKTPTHDSSSNTNDSSLASQFVRSLLGSSSTSDTRAHITYGKTRANHKTDEKQRTSTPVSCCSIVSKPKSSADISISNNLFSGESRLSSVYGSDNY